MNRILNILFLCSLFSSIMACGETNDSRLSGGDSPVLIGKDYLSVLPATIQVGNFPGIFKLNIATNLEFVCLQDEVYASVIGVIFHFGIETNQFENNEKHVLIM